ncbi:hypothetical protein [Mycobacterium angelicum]|uniref:Uncharacterized protein n=1 Tax=Mycobacterium angelicum TaxID=470074 RepID=A0A1W9ZB19_MYCAN|nr:hypothetical protein [Mycobacterium angelicum]MCV7199592.1 hypothetical protein [Mycobacterium angelicum]ORA10299.1 hypothetical protein BST12_26830 [Mycobacterium angelicum]
MAGDIFFLQREWSSSGAAVEYVMRFVASRVSDPSTRNRLIDMVDAGVSLFNLSDPKCAELVDIIADQLPAHVASLEDAQLRKNLTSRFEDLYRCAWEQQDYNRDPTQETFFTIGPDPARYFNLEILKLTIADHLKKVDYVRTDVSSYTDEQRAAVRDYVDKLRNPRVLIVGDDTPRIELA